MEARQALTKQGYKIEALEAADASEREWLKAPTSSLGSPRNSLRKPDVRFPAWRLRAWPFWLALGFLGWGCWEAGRGGASKPRQAVPVRSLSVTVPFNGQLAPETMIDFSFPEIPLVIRRTFKESWHDNQLHLETDIHSSRKVTFCWVRGPKLEKKVSL